MWPCPSRHQEASTQVSSGRVPETSRCQAGHCMADAFREVAKMMSRRLKSGKWRGARREWKMIAEPAILLMVALSPHFRRGRIENIHADIAFDLQNCEPSPDGMMNVATHLDERQDFVWLACPTHYDCTHPNTQFSHSDCIVLASTY